MKPTEFHKIEIEDQTVFLKSSENMKEIPSETVTLIVTSPPYWNVRDYGGEQIGFGQSYQSYIRSLNKVWTECLRVLQPNGKIAINIQPLPIESTRSGFNRRIIQNIMWDIEKFMKKNRLFLSGMHYWDKSEYVSNVSWGSYPKPTNIASNTGFEQIFVWVKPGKTRIVPKEVIAQSVLSKSEWRHWAVRCFWDDIAPVFKIDSKGQNRFGHSAPFPEDIPFRLIRMHTAVGETVLDPFLGSGTTLKMCRITSRRGIGYEINADYAELIRNRIMEEWNPPAIEGQYKVFGTTQFFKIMKLIYNRLKEDPSLTFDSLIGALFRSFPEKITKSWTNHLKHLENTHTSTKIPQKIVLDKYFD
ncbi:MAG: DNA-methyltransferase [Candidatus Hodarchaeota archaeon]